MKDDLQLIIKKPWGYERILEHNDHYVVKLLHVNKGCKLSLQYHERKTETLFWYSGSGFVHLKNGAWTRDCFLVKAFHKVHIPKGQIHRIEAPADNYFEVLEVSTTELSDVVRIEDDYDRVGVLEKSK